MSCVFPERLAPRDEYRIALKTAIRERLARRFSVPSCPVSLPVSQNDRPSARPVSLPAWPTPTRSVSPHAQALSPSQNDSPGSCCAPHPLRFASRGGSLRIAAARSVPRLAPSRSGTPWPLSLTTSRSTSSGSRMALEARLHDPFREACALRNRLARLGRPSGLLRLATPSLPAPFQTWTISESGSALHCIARIARRPACNWWLQHSAGRPVGRSVGRRRTR